MTLARCCRELLALVEIPRGWGGQIDATHAAYPLTSVDYPDAVQNPLFYCNGPPGAA